MPNEKGSKEEEDSDESSSSHDENLFVEFESSDDEQEPKQQRNVEQTKPISSQMQKKPIIQELSSVEFSQPVASNFGQKEEYKNEIVESSMASTPTSNSTKISK